MTSTTYLLEAEGADVAIEASPRADREGVVIAPRRLDLATSQDLRLAMCDALQAASRVTLDLSEVEAMDVVGAAVLVGAARRARRERRDLVITHPSAAATRVLSRCGLWSLVTADRGNRV